jgi:predicted XRE-type DNA-binding protein
MDKLKEVSQKVMAHWTEQSYADFVYRISSDFMLQIEKKLEKDKIKYNEFAARWGVSPARVSQVINDPGNLELVTTVQCARALGMKVALVAYEDGDTENRNGPINPEIFSACWQKAGSPRDFFDLAGGVGKIQMVTVGASHAVGKSGGFSSIGLPLANDLTSMPSRYDFGLTGRATEGIPLKVTTTGTNNAYQYAS